MKTKALIFLSVFLIPHLALSLTITSQVKSQINTQVTAIDGILAQIASFEQQAKSFNQTPVADRTELQLKALQSTVNALKLRLPALKQNFQAVLQILQQSSLDTTEFDGFITTELNKTSLSSLVSVVNKLGGARAALRKAIDESGNLAGYFDSVLSAATSPTPYSGTQNFKNKLARCATLLAQGDNAVAAECVTCVEAIAKQIKSVCGIDFY